MPGPVSDSYDCEWGTSDNRANIEESLDEVYAVISKKLGKPKPLFILDLLRAENMTGNVELRLTIKQWRIIRFALERAKESL